MTEAGSKSRSRLGRGLSSLLNLSDTPVQMSADGTASPTDGTQTPPRPVASDHPSENSIVNVSLESITPNPHQPRRAMDESKLRELSQSIACSGIIQPVLVRPVGSGYQLIAGERRYRAAKLAGLSVIPAIVRQVDDTTQAELALVENVQREDLNPIERASSYRALLTSTGLTQEQLAQRLGEDRSTIANHLRLLDLPEPVRALIQDGRLSLGHAKVLAGVDDPNEQERLARLVVQQGLTVRNLERVIQASDNPTTRQTNKPSAYLHDLETNISRQLGLRVQVRSRGKRGRVVIHYTNLDQFDQLLQRLGVNLPTE